MEPNCTDQNSKGSKSFRLMVAGTFASLAFMSWRILSSPAIVSDLNALPAVVAAESQFRPELDPKIGAHLVVADVGVAHGDLRPTLLVFAGNCAECSIRHFDPRSLDSSQYSAIVLLYDVRKSDVPKQIAGPPRPFRLVCDPEGIRRRALNAAWWPRYYLANPPGVLTDLQSESQAVPAFVHFRPSK